MAWVESHDDIWEHHKTIKLCAMLNRPDYSVVGHLHSLWHFVLRNAWKDANLEAWGDLGIERAARWDGERGCFVKALRECGFLDQYVVHGWMKRAGKLVLDRLYNEARRSDAVKRRKNEKLRRKTEATLPNPTVPNPTVHNHTKPKEKDNDLPVVSSENGVSSKAPNENGTKALTDVQKVVEGWKILNNIPRDDKTWDKVHYPRCTKSAKSLLDLFGNLDDALGCMEFVYDDLTKKGLTCTIETIVKHSDRYREFTKRGTG
jgi:hypothetical protein